MQQKINLSAIKCFLFDMDGTVNLGDSLIPGTEKLFPVLRAAGRRYFFVTNNSSRDHRHYAQKMQKMGIATTVDDILISTDALIYHLERIKPQAKLIVLGTPELEQLLAAAGFRLLTGLAEIPDYIVLGFDRTLNYEKLAVACRWIDRGVPYIATHPDVRCPIEDGEYLPDCGALISLVKTATGIAPQAVCGKPFSPLVDLVRQKAGLRKEEIAMVGDRLHTDIAFGLNNGIFSVLVLTGEATEADVLAGKIKPDLILASAAEITEYL